MPKPKLDKKSGRFIVIDGTDGSGKATQTERLIKKLDETGCSVEVADFPRYGHKSAAMVEEYLNGKFGSAREVTPYQASIFYACDRYAASFQIRKWLKQGKIVISNRYTSANMGHQTGKIASKRARDKYLKWLNNLEFQIFGIPKPDLILLLYMDPTVGQKWVDKKGYRDYVGGSKRDIHEADLDHLVNAAEAYLYVAKKYKWPVIEANQTIDAVHKQIWELVSAAL